MVRKTTSKRANENTPLVPSRTLNHKELVSRLQNALRTQSTFGSNSNAPNRPKKMRTSSGLSHGAKQAFERSKRRNEVKNKLRFRLKTEVKPAAADVEMVDGTTPTVHIRPILLPQELPRPEFKEINLELLKAIVPEVADTNLKYLEDIMSILSPELLKSLCSIKIENITNVLQKEMTVTISEKTEILPSHILAICAPVGKTEVPTGKPRPVTLYPVHTLVLALQCAHLPTPPPTLPVPTMPANLQEPQQIKLPVMSMSIPSPQTYPQLSHYLYTKQLPYLVRSLLPSTPPRSFLEVPEQGETYASHLAVTFRPELIVRHVQIVHGFWQNLCALGIFDEELWCAIEGLWKVLVRALTLAVGEPTVVPLAPPERVDVSQSSSSSSTSSSLTSESTDPEQSDTSSPAPATPA